MDIPKQHLEEFGKVDVVGGEAGIRSDWVKDVETGVITLTLTCFNTVFKTREIYHYDIPEHYCSHDSKLVIVDILPSDSQPFTAKVEAISCARLHFQPWVDLTTLHVRFIELVIEQNGYFDRDFLLNSTETYLTGLYEFLHEDITSSIRMFPASPAPCTRILRKRNDSLSNLRGIFFIKYKINKN